MGSLGLPEILIIVTILAASVIASIVWPKVEEKRWRVVIKARRKRGQVG